MNRAQALSPFEIRQEFKKDTKARYDELAYKLGISATKVHAAMREASLTVPERESIVNLFLTRALLHDIVTAAGVPVATILSVIRGALIYSRVEAALMEPAE